MMCKCMHFESYLSLYYSVLNLLQSLEDFIGMFDGAKEVKEFFSLLITPNSLDQPGE